jgi:prepilin-type N-terminal cleavage/methylation domain-containing protein
MEIRKKTKIKGFTLIEVLVAISILVTVVMATISAAADALSTNNFSKEQVTAYFLAQESIEYIKNIRHQNILQNNSGPGKWLCMTPKNVNDGIPPGYCDGKKMFGINISGTGLFLITPCSSQDNCKITELINGGVDATNQMPAGFLAYYSDNSNPTSYTRTVKINEDVYSALVKVTVGWTKGTQKGSITVNETLYNWVE